MTQKAMTPDCKEWKDFCEKLSGPERCNFNNDTWKCDNTHKNAIVILTKYFPDYNVKSSVAYWEKHGGYCDCEILFNVDDC